MFSQFKKEEKVEQKDDLFSQIISNFELNDQEKLIFEFMACLCCMKDRHDCFYDYLHEIVSKSKNKLLIVNLQMLDLKIQIDCNQEDIESQKDFCCELQIKFEEIGCHKGESLLFYTHGVLEKREKSQPFQKFAY